MLLRAWPAGLMQAFEQSNADFEFYSAVLIARNPVEVTAYNDESLFKEWIENNKAKLYDSFGHQLKKYGFWVITTTYTAPGCSINAWMKKDKEAVLSAKAKAAMVGDFGAELDWTDKITDKDWCHYTAKPSSTKENAISPLSSTTEKVDDSAFAEANPASPIQRSDPKDPLGSEGVVMFYNGHYAGPLEWWVEGAKGIAGSIFGSKKSRHSIDNSKSGHTNLPKNGTAEYIAWDQGQKLPLKTTQATLMQE